MRANMHARKLAMPHSEAALGFSDRCAKTTISPERAHDMKLTHEQAEVAGASREIKSGEALKVIAFAGAGKTTTLKAIANVRHDKGIYLAFNKAIAEEASAKLAGTRCIGSTMHALAYGVQAREIGSPFNLQTRAVVGELGSASMRFPRMKGWGDFRQASLVKRTMANWCASADPEVTRQHAIDAIIETAGDPDTMRDDKRRRIAEELIAGHAEPAMKAATKIFEKLTEQNRWTHDMYLKRLDIEPDLARQALRRFQYILLDEAQDINPVQRSIAVKTGLPLVAVGDPYQQIYSWRGAENALGLLPGKELFLTQSFRFGEEIAQVARDILAARPDGGPAQRLIGAGGHFDKAKWKGAAIAVICRTNIGMFDAALSGSLSNRSIFIDNMEGIQADLMAARALYENQPIQNGSSISQFSTWEELCNEAEAGAGEISRIVQLVKEGRDREVAKLAERNAVSENEAEIAIVTGHRSKGREWPGVRLGPDWKDIDDLQFAYEKAETRSMKETVLAMESFNVLYVAATRAIKELRGVEKLVYPDLDEKQRKREAKRAEMRQSNPSQAAEMAAAGRNSLPAARHSHADPRTGRPKDDRTNTVERPTRPGIVERLAGMSAAIAGGVRVGGIGRVQPKRAIDPDDLDGPYS